MFQSQQRKSKPSSSSSSSETEPASSSSSSFSSLASSSRHRQQQHQQRQHQQKAKMNNTARYNQTCSLNVERVAAVMLSCCASPTTTTTTSPNDIGMDLLQIQQQQQQQHQSEENDDEKKMRNGQQHQLSLAAGGSGPSHRNSKHGGKKLRENRRDTQDSSASTSPDNNGSSREEKPQQKSQSSNKNNKFPSIGPNELIGMVPCGREDLSTSNNTRGDATKNGKGIRRKPFASSPLIDRGDSLVERQASLLSLMASDTMETAEESTVNENGLNNSSYKYSTPDSKRASTAGATAAVTTPRSHNPQKQQTVGRQSSFTTPRRRHVKTSAALSSETMLAPDSPAMELSMAKQFANVAQMSNGNFRKNNRETLRHYRSFDGISGNSPSSPTKKSRGSSGGGGIGSSISVPNLAATGQSLGTQKEDIEEDEGSNNDTIERVVKPFLQFEDAPPPPLWSTITNVNVNSELVSTYEYPRLYLRDPTQIITGNQGDRSNNRNSNSLWWFHLAQRMETTLKHVQDDHWKALLGQQAHANGQNNKSFRGSSDSFSASSTSMQQLPFGCVGLEDSTTADGCVAMSDLCLGQNSQSKTLGGGKSHRKNTSWSSHSSLKNRSRKGTLLMHASSSIDTTTASATAPTFQPSATPVNCWSEPTASTIKVRGKNYSKDGMKVESESSTFKVLGADSFVNNGENATSGGNGSCCSVGTQSFLERFRIACQEVGLDRPPFLLTINFIVPWGNFQIYLIRPDADEDPFSSHDRHSPSEKAWREFMERDKEYRNKRLKLIPRICAGPWMVKKMVGSTPALIGTKLPVSYHGSLSENYLEISLDVTKGPAFGNSVANTVVGKADAVTVDLGFVIEGQEKEHLPERMLGLIRLHHLDMKKAPTQSQWRKEVLRRR